MATLLSRQSRGLYRSLHPSWTTTEVFDVIQNTADPLSETGMGAGRINAYRALLNNNYFPEISYPSPSQVITDDIIDVIGAPPGRAPDTIAVSTAEGFSPLPGAYTVIASSSATVSHGVLATWNNTGLTGPYTIRLMINDLPTLEVTGRHCQLGLRLAIISPTPSAVIYGNAVNIIGTATWEGSRHYTVSTAEGPTLRQGRIR